MNKKSHINKFCYESITVNMCTKIKLIVAYDRSKGIAKKNSIPWKIPSDMNFFADVTKRPSELNPTSPNVVIMGRNTWKALPPTFRGLPDRINIVVSTTMTEAEVIADNETESPTYLARSVMAAIKLCMTQDPGTIGDIYICGGAGIYSEAMTKFEIEEFYLTEIDHDYQTDVFFDYGLVQAKAQYLLRECNTFKVKDLNTNLDVGITFRKYQIYRQQIQPICNLPERLYLMLLSDILNQGQFVPTRNANTWSLFGRNLEFDLSKGFPLLTTKKVFFRGICEELFFFLKGDTNTNHLTDIGVNIWKGNTSREFLDQCNLSYEVGDMGPMYGFNLVHFGAEYEGCACGPMYKGFNQIAYCMNLLKTDPFSRRIIMTTFNPAVAAEGVLYPCHGIVIMFNVQKMDDKFKLNCMMTQRSADAVCGIPFNIGSYALLVHLVCEVINNDVSYAGLKFIPGRLVMNFGDVHIYETHQTQAIRQILRDPYEFPRLTFRNRVTSLTNIKFEDIELLDYKCSPGIIAKMIA